MTNSQKMQEVTGVDNLLKEAGLHDLVDVTVEVLMNDRGKKTPHVVARYWETVTKVNKNRDGYIYIDEVTEKIEELNSLKLGIPQAASIPGLFPFASPPHFPWVSAHVL